MDAIVSYFAMPVGVMICFGPALVCWLLLETKGSNEQNGDKK